MNNSAIHTTFNMKVNKSKSFKLFIYSIAIISAVMKYFARILDCCGGGGSAVLGDGGGGNIYFSG